EDGIRDRNVTGVQTCALPISEESPAASTAVCGAEAKLAGVVSATFSSVGSTMPASGFAAELSSAAWATVAAAAWIAASSSAVMSGGNPAGSGCSICGG